MPVPIFITYKYVGPDLRGRAMNKALKDAVDRALKAHWDSYGVRHFQKTAIPRYGGPYNASRAAKRSSNYKAKLAAKSPSELAAYFAARRGKRKWNRFQATMTPEQRARFSRMSPAARRRLFERVSSRAIVQQTGTNRGTADPKGDTPLVKSGRLQSASRVATRTFHLPVSRRKMRIHSLPWYLTVRRPEQIDKVAAMQATASDERIRFAIRVGKKMQTVFSSTPIRKVAK